uniref:Uncharacterized protein n=1 Tax=Plectus sambesii TaxID=2011161 RepID=A0A914VA27_9BILA
NYLLEAQGQLNMPITEAFATASPHSARPQSKPPTQNGNGSATSPNGSLASSSASSKTRSLPPGAKAPTGGSPQRRLATPPTSGVQRSSYSEDSISSDGSAFSNHGGSATRLQQLHPHKSPSRSSGIPPSAHGSSVSPESGYGADDATPNGRMYPPGSEGREVYNECDPLPALGTCTAIYAFD